MGHERESGAEPADASGAEPGDPADAPTRRQLAELREDLLAEVARRDHLLAVGEAQRADLAEQVRRQRDQIDELTRRQLRFKRFAQRRVRSVRTAPHRLRMMRLRREVAGARPPVDAEERSRRQRVIDEFVARSSMIESATVAPESPTIVLATTATPLVSIIVPVFGAIDDTLACLRSIERHAPEVAVEVIVANDATPEPEFAPIREVEGLRIVDNEANVGFLRNVNGAVEHARGEFVWLLNSDTEIMAGSLDSLVQTFADFTHVGAVGSKLVLPDGSVQEAGGIIWRNGGAQAFARGRSSDAPEVNYARPVDFVSGASLLVRRTTFQALGGFDVAFAPAYYEDTDLCMRLTEVGLRVMYQPESVVVHREGRSYATRGAIGADAPLRRSERTFYRKWSGAFVGRRAHGDRPDLEKDRGVIGRVLVIDARMPTPDQDSGSVRMSNILGILRRQNYQVTLAPQSLREDEPYASALRRVGIEVIHRPHASSIESFLESRGADFDLVILSRLEVIEAQLGAVQRLCPQATIIYDTVDLHFLRQQRELELTGEVAYGFDHEETRTKELAAIESVDLTLVCSSAEKELLAELCPDAPVEVLPNVHEPAAISAPLAERSGLLFVGGFEHPPNADALRWFLRDILPLIVEKLPATVLHVVGSKMPDEIRALASDGVIVHGFVPDLEPLYASARLSIAPLRYGAGVKGKVTGSLAHGLPVVATTMAVEGTDLEAEGAVAVGDTPELFAREVVALLSDDDRWNALADAGERSVRKHFSLERAEAAVIAMAAHHRR